MFLRGIKLLLSWKNFRKFYLYVMTGRMKSIIRKHHDVLLHDNVKQLHNIDDKKVMAADTLYNLDDEYTR
jgi:hypothetical protein